MGLRRQRRAKKAIARLRAQQARALWDEIEAYTAHKLDLAADQLITGPTGPATEWIECQGELARIDHELAARWERLAQHAASPWEERACLLAAVFHLESGRTADLLRGALGRHHRGEDR